MKQAPKRKKGDGDLVSWSELRLEALGLQAAEIIARVKCRLETLQRVADEKLVHELAEIIARVGEEIDDARRYVDRDAPD